MRRTDPIPRCPVWLVRLCKVHRIVAVLLLAVLLSSARATGVTTRSAHRRTAPTQQVTSTQHATRAKRPQATRNRTNRHEAAKRAFLRQTGYPHGRPGYVVDHIIPLACGGADAPSNMQWQTIAAAKAKDKTERRGCR